MIKTTEELEQIVYAEEALGKDPWAKILLAMNDLAALYLQVHERIKAEKIVPLPDVIQNMITPDKAMYEMIRDYVESGTYQAGLLEESQKGEDMGYYLKRLSGLNI